MHTDALKTSRFNVTVHTRFQNKDATLNTVIRLAKEEAVGNKTPVE